MVKKFEEFISEGLWSGTFDRARTGDERKERGKKVKLSIGPEIILHNTEWDYEYLIKEFLDNANYNYMFFKYITGYDYSEQKNIREGKLDYVYLLRDSLTVDFYTHEDMEEDFSNFSDVDISEEDYISVISGIAEALGQIDILEHENRIGDMDYMIVLMSGEETMIINDKYVELTEDITNNLKEEFKSRFNINLFIEGDEDAPTIFVELGHKNLIKYEEYRNFVEEYFNKLK